MASYQDLTVWQKSMDLADEIYHLCRLLPPEEVYCLSSQMRRAAVSVPSNIAEGQKRNSPKDFVQFLSIAAGSCAELETQLLLCLRQNFFPAEQAAAALKLTDEIGKMLTVMISKLKSSN